MTHVCYLTAICKNQACFQFMPVKSVESHSLAREREGGSSLQEPGRRALHIGR